MAKESKKETEGKAQEILREAKKVKEQSKDALHFKDCVESVLEKEHFKDFSKPSKNLAKKLAKFM